MINLIITTHVTLYLGALGNPKLLIYGELDENNFTVLVNRKPLQGSECLQNKNKSFENKKSTISNIS